MIGPEEINGALSVLNPQHDAVRSIAHAFGNAEATPLVNDLLTSMEVDVEALRDFARMQFVYWIEEGDEPALAAAKVEAVILGFNVGVAATRLERALRDE